MNHEIEVKILLTEAQFHALFAYAQSVGGKTQTQTNHYYDTPSEGLRQAGMTLRVRTKDDAATLTLKSKNAKWQTGASSDEYDFAIDAAPTTISLKAYPELVEQIEKRFSPLPEILPCLGSLTTERTCFPLPVAALTAELDKSTYLGKTDFELECELHDRAEEPTFLAFLSERFGITPAGGVCGKYHRFLNRLHELQK